MTSPLRASVRAAFVPFSERFEGRISFLYQDCRGLVTIACGALVDPVEMALTLPLVHNSDGLPATREEIRGAGSVRCRRRTSVTCPPWNGGRPASMANITSPSA